MPDLHPFEATLAALWPPDAWRDVTVLLAVSGGADSVALLRAMAAIRTAGHGRLCVAHFNHRLRGQESASDEAMVVALCRRHDLPCELGAALPGQLTPEGNDGLEAVARAARYAFLEQAAARLGARYVATAHTADDQAETILHRIVRGTGIGGLQGMRRARALGPATTLIRPLLTVRRAELVAYLADLDQPYRTDSSNLQTRATRNRIRHELLPELAGQYNPGVVEALLRLGTLAGEVQSVIDAIVDELAARCVVDEGADAVRIDAMAAADLPRYVVRELAIAVWRERGWPMQSMGFEQWDQLAGLIGACREVAAAPPRQTFPGAVSAEPEPGRLRLRRLGDSAL